MEEKDFCLVMEAMYISTPRDATDVIWMKMFIDELAEA
jgi:hypothetical protein